MDYANETCTSEANTEKIFRNFYSDDGFIEKTAIPSKWGFKSKRGTGFKGYPDFFLNCEDFVIIVEAKSEKHSIAEDEVKWYMKFNNINTNIIGIAISGQDISQVKVTYYWKTNKAECINKFNVSDTLLTVKKLKKLLNKYTIGETKTDEELIKFLNELNEDFNNFNVKDTQRSLLFSGILIALTNNNFRRTYESIQPPSEDEIAKTDAAVPEACNFTTALLNSINVQLSSKINNLSKRFNWVDEFSFVKNLDFKLSKWIKITSEIKSNIYIPFQNDEKQDLLGRAYKIFLSKSGKIDNKNIILTPDHIKKLMIKLARLNLNDKVLDTCTGTGGFLMEAMEKLENLAEDDLSKIEDIHKNRLFGFEVDATLFTLACSNMFLHGDGRSNMFYRNSLLGNLNNQTTINKRDSVLLDYIKSKNITKCIINPPYEKNKPIKFVKQALEFLHPNGELVVIMPTPSLMKNQGIKKSSGKNNIGITEEILKIARLDYVIKMPLNIFNEQGRTVNTSIFKFTKTPHLKSDEVLFYFLEDDGFVSVQHKGRVDKFNKWNDLENHILSTVNNKTEITNISKKLKIYNKKGELNCAGWKETLNQHLVLFSELFNIEMGSMPSQAASGNGEYKLITASNEPKNIDSYEYDKEAIVYAVQAAGSLGKSQYVNGKFTASNLCCVLTPKDMNKYPINLKFYNWYFSSIRKQVFNDLADGTSKLTIPLKQLKNYHIEYIPIEKQNSFVEKYILEYDKLSEKLSIIESEIIDSMTKYSDNLFLNK